MLQRRRRINQKGRRESEHFYSLTFTTRFCISGLIAIRNLAFLEESIFEMWPMSLISIFLAAWMTIFIELAGTASFDVVWFIHFAFLFRTARGWDRGSALSFSTKYDRKVLYKVRRSLAEAAGSEVLKPYRFRMEELDGFRYRAKVRFFAGFGFLIIVVF